jgi:hypothetical protein
MSWQVTYIVTPQATQNVRDHFTCDTLQGAELEDSGTDATAGSHWEKRVYDNELRARVCGVCVSVGRRRYMTGSSDYNPRFSNITMGLVCFLYWCVTCTYDHVARSCKTVGGTKSTTATQTRSR